MMRLIAQKPMTYRTRRLQAGDAFEANDQVGSLLVKIRKAALAPPDQHPHEHKPPELKPSSPVVRATLAQPMVSASEDALVDALRVRARQLGVMIDRRWGSKRLQTEIDART